MKHFYNLSELHDVLGIAPPEHPLFSVLQGEEESTCGSELEFTSDFYFIGLRKMRSGSMLYGKTKYDHDRGSLAFFKPNQHVSFNNIRLQERGFVIYIHQDYLTGTSLFNDISKYSFFDYEINEALHLTPAEEIIIWELYNRIEAEYNNNVDEFSKTIMLSHVDSILKYSDRFYRRQFINRKEISGTTVTRFTALLQQYSTEDMLYESGMPNVQSMAEELHLSPRYLSDLLKQETGKTAIELIHIFLIGQAKNMLSDKEKNITEIAYTLGFDNPTYFSRLFKREVGMPPNKFRKQLMN